MMSRPSCPRMFVFVLSCVALLPLTIPASAERPVLDLGKAVESPSVDPTVDEVSVVGEVVVESYADGLVAVAIDRAGQGSRPDGLADNLAFFRSSQPVDPPISFRGQAVVDFGRRSLRVTPLGPGESLELYLDGEAVPATNNDEGRRLTQGRELVYRTQALSLSLDQVLYELRGTASPLRPRTAAVEPENQDQGGSGSGGGCAESCSISCAAGGGSCSASCSQGSCAKCSCNSSTNLASCSCQ